MRLTSAFWPYAVAASHGTKLRVESWRDGARLVDDVPVTEAALAYDDTADLRRQLTMTVPARTPDGTLWEPRDDPAHALAYYGQTLHVLAGIAVPGGGAEMLDHGWYLVTSWEHQQDGNTVSVTAVDLSQRLIDDRLYHAESPPSGATYGSELRRLAKGNLPVWISPDVQDGPINPTTVWDRDRLTNIKDLAKAWGVRILVDDAGRLAALPAYGPITADTRPVMRLTAGYGGTVIDRGRSGDRETQYNAVVVTGKTPETEGAVAPWAVAEITDPASPVRVGGPYGRKPRFYSSDLLVTTDQCQQAADGLLATISGRSRSETIQAVPDGSLELGDVVEVVTSGDPWTGRVTAVTLPLLATGAMDVTVSTVPADNDDGGS
jgi:hypothetical protein